MTPQEARSGQKPGVGHLRVFGNIAYAYVPKQRRKVDHHCAEFVLMATIQKSRDTSCMIHVAAKSQ